MDMPWTGHVQQYYQVEHHLNRHGQVVGPHVQCQGQLAHHVQFRGSGYILSTIVLILTVK